MMMTICRHAAARRRSLSPPLQMIQRYGKILLVEPVRFSVAASRRHSSMTTAERRDDLVYAQEAPVGYDGSAVVYSNVISEAEEEALRHDLQQIFRRRRYEKGHWDAVIIKYKETELYNEPEQLSETSRLVLERIRQYLMEQQHVAPDITWLPSHAIELHPEGELRAHVDSVRFSGGLVAGLSIGSASIMRLQPPKDDYMEPDDESLSVKQKDSKNGDANEDKAAAAANGHVDLLLYPRSLYALTGRSRYEYTHELLPNESSVFAGTGQVVQRNQNRWSIIFRDSKQD